MQSRTWVLVLALIIAFFVLIIHHGWTLFKANEKIKNYLLTQLRPVLDEECNIDYLEMGLGVVHLKGVHIIFKNSYYTVWIEELRIGYSLASLIKNGFKPKKAPQDILFINPQLTITYIPKELKPSHQESESHYNSWDKMKDFDFLKRITVSKGSIVYIDSLGNKTTLATDISGWVSTKNFDHAQARLVGKLFYSKQLNLRLNGEIDLLNAKLDTLQVNLINFQWKEKVPFFISQYVDVKKGKINGNILISQKNNDIGFDIDGKISIVDGEMRFQDEHLNISNINLEADIKTWDLIIKKSYQIFNGSPISIEGKIKNILNPEFLLELHSESFDIYKFQNYLFPRSKYKFTGNSSLKITVHNSFEHPLINGVIASPHLNINKEIINDVNLKFTFQDSILSITNLSGKYNSVTVNGKGKVDFSHPDSSITMQIIAQGNLPHDFKIQNINSLGDSYCNLNLGLWGNFNKLNGRTNLVLKSQFNNSTILDHISDFSFSKEAFIFSTYSNKNKSVVSGSVKFNKGYELQFINAHEIINQFPEYQPIIKIFNWRNSKIKVNSQSNKTEISGDFDWKNNVDGGNRIGHLSIKITGDKTRKKIIGNFLAKFGSELYEAKANLTQKANVLDIQNIEISNILNANGIVDLSDKKEIAGKIKLNSDLNHIYNLFTLNSSFINQGKLIGNIEIGGTINKPIINGLLKMENSYINHVGTYDGLLAFNFANQQFRLDQFKLNKNDSLLFEGLGNYDNNDDNANFKFWGDKIDLNNLFKTLLNKNDFISGEATANLYLLGSLNNLQLAGNIDVDKGKLIRFYFDSINVELGIDHNVPDDNKAGIKIDKFLLTRKDQFKIEAQGVIPFSSEDSMGIDLIGQGNLLSILPEITPFFIKTASKGNWQMRLSGSPAYLIIERGDIIINEGYLKLGNVAPEIKNISATIKIEPDGFVNLHEINGEIKGKPFRFINYKASHIPCSKNFIPFTIPDIGLDFGVFSLETSTSGVPLHIPGLMAKSEFGFFEFIGRGNCDKFYVAGPTTNPVVSGNIRLRKVNLMYPFAEVPRTDEDNPVVRLLKKINWNVKGIPEKDTRYEKEIPSGVDRVYVNLLLDNETEGLDFNGVIDDNTFCIKGKLESTEGSVDYLDFDFRIEKAGVEFDKSTLLPIAFGRAKATVVDSMGMPNYIYLTLLLEDEITGQTQPRGRWEKIQFKLSTDNPTIGITEGEILASLGYSGEKMKEKATDIIGISTDNLLFRPLLRPFERELERKLNLDLVRFSSRFTRNLIEMNLWREDVEPFHSKLYLLKSTRLMVGKYLINKLFFSYIGELETATNYRSHVEELGLKHSLGLEYRINPNLQLEMEYNYNSFLLEREDKRIFLRHSFPLQ